MGRQAFDIWGLVGLVLGALCALAVYSDLAGPVGHSFDRGAEWLLGGARYLVPLAVALLSWALIREGHPRRRAFPTGAGDHAAGEEAIARPPARVAVGCAVVLVTVAGMARLVEGPARWTGTGGSALRHSGGLVGEAAGVPLRAALGGWGAAMVLAAALVAALLIATSTSARAAAEAVAGGVSGLVRGTVASVRWVAGIPARAARREAHERHPAAGEHPSSGPGVYDGEAELGPHWASDRTHRRNEAGSGPLPDPVAREMAIREARKDLLATLCRFPLRQDRLPPPRDHAPDPSSSPCSPRRRGRDRGAFPRWHC